MTRKYNYFYKITNLINQHYYYGIHSTNNLNDNYMGSGSRLKIAYQKYGIENFKKEILRFFDTRKEALEYEEEVVNETLVNDTSCYNLIKGGYGDSAEEHVCSIKGNSFKKDNIVVKLKGTDKFFVVDKKDISTNLYEYTWSNRHHTEESKEKTRKSMTPVNSTNPRIWVSKEGAHKYIRKELLNDFLQQGWQLGRIKS